MTQATVATKMQIGRNIIHEDIDSFAVAIRYPLESTIRKWHFDTHRKAMRKFNQLSKNCEWLPIYEDISI